MAKAKTCNCAQLPDVVEGNKTHPPHKNLQELDHRIPPSLDQVHARYHTYLMECVVCDQIWQVDGSTKVKYAPVTWTTLCIKLGSREGWQQFDDLPIRLNYLTLKDGGLSDEKCMFAGCVNAAVLNKAFCPRCNYFRMLNM